jgi:putative transposase
VKINQADFPVAQVCRVLGLSTSGYYACLKRPPSARSQANSELLERMKQIHRFSRDTYRRPRLHAELRSEGLQVNHERVGQLMREEGLVGATRRRKWRTTVRDKDARPAPDLVSRNFVATAPDQL